MKQKLEKIARKELKYLLELREPNESSGNDLSIIMKELCGKLNLFYHAKPLSPHQFEICLEAYLKALRDIK